MSKAQRKALSERAASCWSAPTCPVDEARARTHEGLMAGSEEMGCWMAYYGIGLSTDLPLARACLERDVARESPSEEQSPSFDRILLTAMLLDGQAGPRQPERARALLEPVFQDGTVEVLRSEIDERKDGSDKPLDVCADPSGTTTLMLTCANIVQLERALQNARVAEKTLAATLDKAGARLLGQAIKAWEAFAVRDAELAADVYRGGTMSAFFHVGRLSTVHDQRAEAARRALGKDREPDPEANNALKETLRRAHEDPDLERRKLLQASQSAWLKVRDAHAALVRHLQNAGDPDAAKAAAPVDWLTRQRAEALAKMRPAFE